MEYSTAVMKFLAEFIVGLVVWLMIGAAIAFIVTRLQKGNFDKAKRNVLILACVVSLATSGKGLIDNIQNVQADGLGKLTQSERTRYMDIVRGTLQDPNYLTPTIRTEFWSLVYKAGSPSNGAIQKSRKDLLDAATYTQFFYQDALLAYRTRKPVKSTQRAQQESDLRSRGLVSDTQLKKNEDLMAKIAVREPYTSSDDRTVQFDEETIQTVLDRYDVTIEQLGVLFTPP